jgi:hypothetical protein
MKEIEDKMKEMLEAAAKLMQNEHAMSEEKMATMLGKQAEYVSPKYEPRLEIRAHLTYKEIIAIVEALMKLDG